MQREFTAEVGPTGRGVITLEGREISNAVSGFTLEAAPGEYTTLTLRIDAAHTRRLVGQAEVILPDDTVNLLLSLGWTPPPAGSDAPGGGTDG
ncbi:hypothetical protein [Nocardiopsis sp. NPDC057823]|uniref:hypothetical protein n=1 Tax=Nocardiopsis sp. NPDC057823 TaxID=3346256 RepID=UPI003672E293